jgi:4-amino-4-deoxy-L-arabinose transferase-like glycosyltransferase
LPKKRNSIKHFLVIHRDQIIPGLVIFIFFITMLLIHPAEIPPFSWDEGWSMAVAKNWVLTGRYAVLLLGSPVSAIGMAKSISITGPIALSFRIFGVGIWQGRLPAIISISLALFLIFRLVRQLFNLRISYLSFFALLLIAVPTINPWIIGREALAEAPMVFYLSVGYLCLLASLKGKKYTIFPTILFWGLALDAKGHVIPFLTASIILPVGITFIRKQWHFLRIMCISLIGSFFVYFLLLTIQNLLYGPYPLYNGSIGGIYSLVGLVTTVNVRLVTLTNIFLYGVPTLLGLVIGFRRIFEEYRSSTNLAPVFYVTVALYVLVVSWFLWFILFSIGWGRYYFPVSFFGSIFIALLLSEFLDKVKELTSVAGRKSVVDRLFVYLLLIVIVYSVTFNIYMTYYQIITGNDDPAKVANYVRENIRPDAQIESYESQILFLVDNPIHYPPDQVQLLLDQRTFLEKEIYKIYDPSQVKFEYLIDGPNSKLWHLYIPLLEQGHFQLIYEAGDYKIYKRLP